jgi:hypothetical protein
MVLPLRLLQIRGEHGGGYYEEEGCLGMRSAGLFAIFAVCCVDYCAIAIPSVFCAADEAHKWLTSDRNAIMATRRYLADLNLTVLIPQDRQARAPGLGTISYDAGRQYLKSYLQVDAELMKR